MCSTPIKLAIFENNVLPLIFTQKSMELLGRCGEGRWKRERNDMEHLTDRFDKYGEASLII